MHYPLNLNRVDIYPLFGDYLKGEPYIFDFSSLNPKTYQYDLQDFEAFNQLVFEELEQSDCSWGIGKYLEERKSLLRDYPNMINEQRYYHLGLDIIVPFNTPMFSPLDATVFKTGKETIAGNYGGYIILEHHIKDSIFYSLYGHMKTPHALNEGDKVRAGQIFAHIGKESDSGGWFCHTHMQILTQEAVDKGYANLGYCSPDMLPELERYFPSPYPLFKF